LNIIENIRLALSSIWANKMRSFLTMLGIIIGIAAVVAISAIGNGGRYQIQKSMEQFGTNRLMIYMNWSNQSEITSRDFFNDRDIEALRKLDGIEAITPILEGSSTLSTRGNKINVILIGANEDSQIVTNVKLLKGRFISEDDVSRKNQNIVISEREARELFGTTNVIGEEVTMNTSRGPIGLKIIGVSEHEENMLSGTMNNGRAQIYVPISTIMRIFNLKDYYGVNIKVEDKDNMDHVSTQAIKLLERLHNNKEKYTAFNMEQMLETVNKVLSTVTTVLGAIAAIALLVGGIGIMNIMLVAVTERIREIGIKKAIGAKRSTILLQFLTESAIISLLGGVIGIIIGYLLSFIISSLLNLPPLIRSKEVLVASAVAVGIGIVFGVYPASRASKLDPIEALRYE